MEKRIRFDKEDIFKALESTYHYKMDNAKIDYYAGTQMDAEDLSITIVLKGESAKCNVTR